jgi:hypothetical protein
MRVRPDTGETSERWLCTFNSEGFSSDVFQFLPTNRVAFIADGDINGDGSPHAYHPAPHTEVGLDALANAGHAGHWFGIVTDRVGQPFIQTAADPAPGFYVSSTSYQRPEFPKNNPRRYLDSEKIPFIVVEDYIRRRAKGIVLGCRARVTNLRNGQSVDCVVGDMGPLKKIGELSIACAAAIGIPSNPRNGGTDDAILRYELWPDVPARIGNEAYNLIPVLAAAD